MGLFVFGFIVGFVLCAVIIFVLSLMSMYDDDDDIYASGPNRGKRKI